MNGTRRPATPATLSADSGTETEWAEEAAEQLRELGVDTEYYENNEENEFEYYDENTGYYDDNNEWVWYDDDEISTWWYGPSDEDYDWWTDNTGLANDEDYAELDAYYASLP